MPLNPTPGASDANSYCSVEEADAYNASRLFASTWSAADETTKTAALLEAARLLDSSFDWTGRAADETQYMAWPRTGMFSKNKFLIDPTTIPQQLKEAQAEFARQLIDGDRTADNDAFKAGLEGLTAGPVTLKFRVPDGGSSPTDKDADVRRQGPDFDYLASWIPDAVRNLLVKTWYRTATVTQPLVFAAFGGNRHPHHGGF